MIYHTFPLLSIRLFADDTVLTMSGNSLETLHDKVIKEIRIKTTSK